MLSVDSPCRVIAYTNVFWLHRLVPPLLATSMFSCWHSSMHYSSILQDLCSKWHELVFDVGICLGEYEKTVWDGLDNDNMLFLTHHAIAWNYFVSTSLISLFVRWCPTCWRYHSVWGTSGGVHQCYMGNSVWWLMGQQWCYCGVQAVGVCLHWK